MATKGTGTAETKKRKYRSLEFTPSPGRKQLETKQLVVTLSVPKGDVVKVETLGKSGQRHEVSEEEFAQLAGEDEMEDLGGVLEEAYVAGINDAIHDALGEEEEEDEEEEGENDQEEEVVREFVLRRAAGRQLVRRGVRQLILRRVLRRELIQRRKPPERKAGRKGSKD